MPLKTPFFKAFGPLLFGRGKTSTLKAVAELESLEDLYAIFGHLFEVHLLEPTAKGVNSRLRRLPAAVTFWAFVAQALSPSQRVIDHAGNTVGQPLPRRAVVDRPGQLPSQLIVSIAHGGQWHRHASHHVRSQRP